MPEEALQIAEKRRDVKGKGEKERYIHLNAQFQRIARRDKKAFLSEQCKRIEKKIEWERLEISSRKLEIPRDHVMKNGHNKGQIFFSDPLITLVGPVCLTEEVLSKSSFTGIVQCV